MWGQVNKSHEKWFLSYSDIGVGSTKKTVKHNETITIASIHINRLRKQFSNNDKVGISLQKEFQMDNKRYLCL